MLEEAVDGGRIAVADAADAKPRIAGFPTTALAGQFMIVRHGSFME